MVKNVTESIYLQKTLPKHFGDLTLPNLTLPEAIWIRYRRSMPRLTKSFRLYQRSRKIIFLFHFLFFYKRVCTWRRQITCKLQNVNHIYNSFHHDMIFRHQLFEREMLPRCINACIPHLLHNGSCCWTYFNGGSISFDYRCSFSKDKNAGRKQFPSTVFVLFLLPANGNRFGNNITPENWLPAVVTWNK